jgi:hypothetical protein
MNENMASAVRLVKLLHARQDAATVWPEGRPAPWVAYRPETADFKWVAEKVASHLRGKTRVAPKLVVNGTTCAGIIDLDSHDPGSPVDRLPDAQRLLGRIWSEGFVAYAARSRGGLGVHVWVFFDRAVSLESWRSRADSWLTKCRIPLGAGKAEILPCNGDYGTCPFLPYYNREEAERTGLGAFLDHHSLRPIPLDTFLATCERNSAGKLRPKPIRRKMPRASGIYSRLGLVGPKREAAERLPKSVPGFQAHRSSKYAPSPASKGSRWLQARRAALHFAKGGGTFADFCAWDQLQRPPLATDQPDDLPALWCWAEKFRPINAVS